MMAARAAFGKWCSDSRGGRPRLAHDHWIVTLMILVPNLLSASGVTIEALIKLLPTFLLGGAGAGVLAWNRLSLPRWADERELQMEQIAARVRALVEEPRSDESGT